MNYSILILTNSFGKPAYIPRLRSLCDYLRRKGYNIDVYTELGEPILFEHQYNIIEIPIYRDSKADWLLKSAWTMLTNWKDRYFAKQVIKLTDGKHYDLVFCTTFSFFPLTAAKIIAKHLNLPLHLDIRDLEEQISGQPFSKHQQKWLKPIRKIYTAINIKRRNRTIQQAQTITTVAKWHTDFLFKLNCKTHLIYNGFNPNLFSPQVVKSDFFYITYTGRIYDSHFQDPTLFFSSISDLKHSLPKLRIRWYIDEQSAKKISKLAQQYQVADITEIHQYVEPKDVPHILSESSIILVLSQKCTDIGPHGVLSTKLYEAIGVEKPVLCVRSDEEELEELINNIHCGIAARNEQKASHFIRMKYAQWQTEGNTTQPIDPQVKQLFNREHQAEQFISLFPHAVTDNNE